MERFVEINRLKYNLENRIIREWALKFGIVKVSVLIEVHRDLYLGGERVRRRDLSPNDRDIIKRVFSWWRGNS